MTGISRIRAISHGSTSHQSRRPDRSGSRSGHGAASFVFFGPGRQQSGHSSRIWSGCDAACWKWCGGGGAGSNFPATHAYGDKYFDADGLCQGQMAAGHGGLLLAACCLTLPGLPESRLSFQPFLTLSGRRMGNEKLPPFVRSIHLLPIRLVTSAGMPARSCSSGFHIG